MRYMLLARDGVGGAGQGGGKSGYMLLANGCVCVGASGGGGGGEFHGLHASGQRWGWEREGRGGRLGRGGVLVGLRASGQR